MNDIINLPALEIDKLVPAEIFVPGGMASIIERLKSEITKEVMDATTEEGRKRVKSVAYKVSRSKTILDDMGKQLTEDWKAKSKIVDNERKFARDELDALKEEILKPVTEWENTENLRIVALRTAIETAQTVGKDILERWADIHVDAMQERIDILTQRRDEIDWEEFADWAEKAHNIALVQIGAALEKKKKYDIEQEELAAARVQLEQLQREKREREIADAAAAKAKQEAEDLAAREATRTARETQEAADRAENERLRQLKEADNARLEAQRQIEIAQEAQKQAEERATRERADADRRAEEAVERERERKLAEENAAIAEHQKRQADKAHRVRYDNAAANAIIDILERNEANRGNIALDIIEAISDGKIPHVTINY